MSQESSSQTARRWVIRIGALVVIAAIAVAAFPMLMSSLQTDDDEDVLTHRVTRGDLSVTVTENGTLESSSNMEIKCEVRGGSTVLWVIETGTMVEPGDVLVELDTSQLEDNITQQQISYENAMANKIISESDVAVAKTSITEYLEGTYKEEKSTIEKEIFDAEESVRSALLSYQSAQRLAAKGIGGSLQLEGELFAVESAKKELELKQTRLVALEKYTKEKMLQELRSTLSAAEARLAADEAALSLEKQRLEREKTQLENCTIRANGAGLVIFPSAAEWKGTPDIEEGATVREQQTLLMIPDLNQMQVKVGVHESKVDRLTLGMRSRVQMQDEFLEGSVSEIAKVTRPAGWWTGNLVKYDTIIKLEGEDGLKPGMSAIVEIILAEYKDVLSVPVSCILETPRGFVCWVKTETGVEETPVEVGDTNDEFTIVSQGLSEGDEVVLNPMRYVDEADLQSVGPGSSVRPPEGSSGGEETKSTEVKPGRMVKDEKKPAATITGSQIVAAADKNKDGVLTKDEFSEKDRSQFSNVDSDSNGKVTAAELDAAMEAAKDS